MQLIGQFGKFLRTNCCINRVQVLQPAELSPHITLRQWILHTLIGIPQFLTQIHFMELLEDLPLPTRIAIWFTRDGAPPHFSLLARDFLREI